MYKKQDTGIDSRFIMTRQDPPFLFFIFLFFQAHTLSQCVAPSIPVDLFEWFTWVLIARDIKKSSLLLQFSAAMVVSAPWCCSPHGSSEDAFKTGFDGATPSFPSWVILLAVRWKKRRKKLCIIWLRGSFGRWRMGFHAWRHKGQEQRKTTSSEWTRAETNHGLQP